MKTESMFALAIAGVSIAGKGYGQELPPSLNEIIAAYEGASEQTDESPVDGFYLGRISASSLEIWRYEYQGVEVFYLPFSRTHCCDALSMLYGSDGELICMPDGGFTGKGDGKCPDFAVSRSRGALVYPVSQAEPLPDEDDSTETPRG